MTSTCGIRAARARRPTAAGARRRCRSARTPAGAARRSSSTRVLVLLPLPYSISVAPPADRGGHLAGVAVHDGQLGARQVILVELADPVEQPRALRVVKVLARQPLSRAAQAGEHLGEHAVAAGAEVAGGRRGGEQARHRTSLASRMPVNCHRASGGKKLRYVRRMCDARRGARPAAEHELVAHELAVVLAERAGRRDVAGIGEVLAARPFPDVAEHLGERRGRIRAR